MRSNPSMRQVLKVQNNLPPKLSCAGLPWSCLRVLLDLEYVLISGLKSCENICVLSLCTVFFFFFSKFLMTEGLVILGTPIAFVVYELYYGVDVDFFTMCPLQYSDISVSFPR